MAPTPPNRTRVSLQKNLTRILNSLTLLFLFGVFVLAGIFSLIYLNPYLPLNPFPPPTLPPTAYIPSPPPTVALNLPPTWTLTAISQPTLTATPAPTETGLPTSTIFTLLTASATLPATVPPGGYPYEMQAGSPYHIANLYYPEKGCNWMGVGGQVVDISGAPVTGLIIRLGGALPGLSLSQPILNLTGVALNYGQSGYEFTLADHPIASRGTLWLQLLDQAGIALSDKFSFDTFAECDQNLIIINFKRIR